MLDMQVIARRQECCPDRTKACRFRGVTLAARPARLAIVEQSAALAFLSDVLPSLDVRRLAALS